jgi:hypothetical protein
MNGRQAPTVKPRQVMRNALDYGRSQSATSRGGVRSKSLGNIPTQQAAITASPGSKGMEKIAAITITQEVVLPGVPDTTWEIAGTGDFNGDQKTDLLWRNYGTGTYQGFNVIWYMNGTILLGENAFSVIPDTNWRIAGTGDFNGDKKTDILWRYYGAGPNQGLNNIWYMNGDVFLGEAAFSAVLDTGWEISGTGDFNGDQRTDILWRYYGTGPFQGVNDIWYMNGTTFLGESVFSSVTDTAWKIGGTGDFNGDGSTDILWRYYGAGPFQGLNDIWYMNGTTLLGEDVFSSVPDTTWRIVNH